MGTALIIRIFGKIGKEGKLHIINNYVKKGVACKFEQLISLLDHRHLSPVNCVLSVVRGIRLNYQLVIN